MKFGVPLGFQHSKISKHTGLTSADQHTLMDPSTGRMMHLCGSTERVVVGEDEAPVLPGLNIKNRKPTVAQGAIIPVTEVSLQESAVLKQGFVGSQRGGEKSSTNLVSRLATTLTRQISVPVGWHSTSETDRDSTRRELSNVSGFHWACPQSCL
jgi:hypothetical protein